MREEIWQARIERVKECFAAGLNQYETAEYLGINATTVRTYVRRVGLSAPSGEKNLQAIFDCAARGLSRAETAAELGICLSTVGAYGRQHAIPFRHASAVLFDPRSEPMAAMYKAGKTLEEIGQLYGLTRERVRQIISKYHGITALDGGNCIRAKSRQERAAARKNARYLAKYGCTFADWQDMVRVGKEMRAAGKGRYRSPTYAFVSQRSNARARGIEWELTLLQWWTIWQASGKWDLRGRGQGYMMCRFGDAGSYSVGNVYIATGVHNGAVQPNNPYRVGHPDHEKVISVIRHKLGSGGRTRKTPDMHTVHAGLPKGVTLNKGRFQAQASIYGKRKYLGSFSTPEEAHQAYVAAISAPLEVAA